MPFFRKKEIPTLPSGQRIPRPEAFHWERHFTALGDQADEPLIRKYYSSPPVSGATPLHRISFLALDLETTGLDPEKDRIVSIGFIPFDIKRIYCSGARNFLVNPGQPLPEKTVTIHGITHSDLNEKPGFDQVLPFLLKAMEGRLVVVHYHFIERNFLAAATRECFSTAFEFPMIDTMIIEKQRLLPGKPALFLNRFRKKPRVSFRLDASRSRYGLPRYHPHHALTDALAAAELFQAQVGNLFSPETPVRSLWV
ncbi:3'-5' exonuclease [Desulfospira joergensenii]|uniref:3'-5' exonuclease n=1 Tax=Desulfospira joergensenii TaxID=53329 RepID=UPI0003B719C5|nr:3'-5' exonuclease [Desulfospira joergensenii]